jgi:NosR/NirI family transcriptional regulator, nitrous oxide reductase regulator
MLGLIKRYTRWIHTGWPAGTVEKLPLVNEDGSTGVPGLYVVGDLTGIPLLKFSSDSGARAVQTITADPGFTNAQASKAKEVLDLVVIGGGVSGMAAALEARKSGLDYVLIEASQPFSTVANFPKGKPIYTYPTDMVPAGDLQFTAQVKEPLLDEMKAQTLGQGIEPKIGRVEQVVRAGGGLLRVDLAGEEPIQALRVIVGIGRSGNFRKLGVPGEELDKVSNRLHDPKDYVGQDVLVVGGGDSALESAIALTQCGARVTLSYRKPEFARPKPDNVAAVETLTKNPSDVDVGVEHPTSERQSTATGRFLTDRLSQAMAPDKPQVGSLRLAMASQIKEISEDAVSVTLQDGTTEAIPNQAVFAAIGREAPLDFFRRSGVKIRGEWSAWSYTSFALFMAFCVWLYLWKSGVPAMQLGEFSKALEGWPGNMHEVIAGFGDWWAAKVADRTSVVGVLAQSMRGQSFYYTFTYCMCVLIFGIRRIRRRKTPYVKVQTASLIFFQWIPLFLLPELFLPLLGYNGAFQSGLLGSIADSLFPLYHSSLSDLAPPDWGHPRAYWKSYGLILAWPLSVWQVFADATVPWGWVIVGTIQTFVIIPALVWRFGKGAYCGWICSCGALAETLGDEHRYKMPHGPLWNRLNMLGQVILFLAFALLAMRIAAWIQGPEGAINGWFLYLFKGVAINAQGQEEFANALSYKWVVDTFLAGIVGVGFYFWFSGRAWCRFACPLAALMHIYARFSQFRILSDKKKCISCNVCTSVCHQGIDIMNFANKGLPMEDPECVRCSACVQSCPTGVLTFGRVDGAGAVLGQDPSWLAASPVQMAEASKRKLPMASMGLHGTEHRERG